MRTERRTRLDPATFQLPVEKMRDGYYSDAYFTFTREVLESDAHRPDVLMQVFQRERSVLGGVDEALAILKLCSGRRLPDGGWENGWDRLEVWALHDGDAIEPWETVLTIQGDYSLFAHLETLYLGVLARRTLIGRNVRDVVEAARGKPILYFPARFDHWQVQTGDGWAAHIAGAIGVSTDAQASWWGGKGMGTVPHGLIAAYGGDTVLAARKFADRFADELHVTVLVDFENDSVRTALEVADALGPRLWGVRLDTSSTMVDRSLWHELGRFRPTGVVPELVWKVRRALDNAGHRAVRIVASGGFDARRIREFEEAAVPVDAYGVGTSLLDGRNDFTADVVRVEGVPCAKVGPRGAAQPAPGAGDLARARPAPPRGLRGRRPRPGARPAGAVARPDARPPRGHGRAGRGGRALRRRGRPGGADPPLDPESAIARFMETRGEGFHHVAFAVPDLEAALADLRARGAELIDAHPRRGLGGHMVAFVHPRSGLGVLTELVQAGRAGHR